MINEKELVNIAKEKTWQDFCRDRNEPFCLEDWSAGNFDDTYYGGMVTGRVELAREILKQLGYRRCDIAACNCGSYHKE